MRIPIALSVGVILAAGTLAQEEPSGVPSQTVTEGALKERLREQLDLAERIVAMRADRLAVLKERAEQGLVSAEDVGAARREWIDARLRLLDARQQLELAGGGAAEAAELAAERVALTEERLASREADLERLRLQVTAGVVPAERLVEQELAVLEARLAVLEARRAQAALEQAARERQRRIARLDRGIAHSKQRVELAEEGLARVRELHAAGRASADDVVLAEERVRDARLRRLDLEADRARLGSGGGEGRLVDIQTERVSIVEARVVGLRQRLRTMRLLHESGNVPKTDVDMLERELHDAELRLVDMRDELDAMQTR